jgi:outer membrane protein assembly factor BamB
MNEYGTFERALMDFLADETAGAPVDRIATNVVAATRSVRPSPTWLATLRQPALRLGGRASVGVSRRRLALGVAIATLLVAGAVAVVGSLLTRGVDPDWTGPRGGPARTGGGFVGPVGLPVEQWRVSLGGALRTDPAITGDTVVVAGEDGILYALALANGRERWRFDPGTSVVGPTTDGSTVFVVDGRGIVHALGVARGNALWQSAPLAQGANGTVAAEGQLFIPTADGSVIAIDATNGTERWRASIGAAPVHTLAYADGRVLAATDDGLFVALEAGDGDRIWVVETGADGTGTPVIANGIAYLGSHPEAPTGRLRAVDAATGAARWTIDEPLQAPAVLGSLAVSASSTGVVVALDAHTGTERWRFASEGSTTGPSIGGDVVFVSNDLGQQIFALDARTGGLLWTFEIDGDNHCCVAIAKGYAIVGTDRGWVYAIRGDGIAVSPAPASPRPSISVSPPPRSPALPEALSVVREISTDAVGIQDAIALAVGPAGDIYVTDRSNQVTHLDADGAFVARWGGLGSGPGQFDFRPANSSANVLGSIAVGSDGLVYVSDTDNHRVQVFTGDGDYVREFGAAGAGPGEFTLPFDLSVDAEGNVYVADDGLERITRFSPTGEVVWIADGSTHPALEGHAHSLDIDAEGRIVAIIDDTGTVVLLDPDGTVVETYVAPGCDVTMDAAGRHYVTSCEGTVVTVYGPDRQPVAQSGTLGMGPPQFGPDGQVVALSHDGSIVFLAVATAP